jgi:hypothetical protein
MASKVEVGTLAWMELTGGRLRGRDKLAKLLDGVTLLGSMLSGRLRHGLGIGSSGVCDTDLETLEAPDTQAAKDSFEMCETLSPRYMVNHCMRTYWYARLFALRWGLEFDNEILYVGAFLHDIALMPGFVGRSPEEHCFSLPSARCARRLVAQAGWDGRRQERVAEAITLNPNHRVRREQGIEAYLLNAAVQMEALKFRAWDIHPNTVARVLQRAPRLEVTTGLAEIVNNEANAHPGSRFHFARRYFRFVDLFTATRW